METTERARKVVLADSDPASFEAALCRDVDAALLIVQRVAKMPCVCHPMDKAEGATCLGDEARSVLEKEEQQ